MTRFKKELERKGFELEHNLECLPTRNGLEAVIVNVENLSITYFYSFIIITYFLNRNLEIEREVID